MWHHATYRGDELIVLGHNPQRNDCMLVKLSGLPMNEAQELRKIAQSRAAQESDYLIPVLRRVESPYGSDWFSFLCKKMEQRGSAVFTLPIKEIQDSLDVDQKAKFKGYGKGRKNQQLMIEDLERENTGGYEAEESDQYPPVRRPGHEAHQDASPRRPGEVRRPTDFADAAATGVHPMIGHQPQPDVGYKIDLLSETIADEGRETRQLLNQLLTVMAGNHSNGHAKPEKAPRPPRKPRADRPSRRHADAEAVANEA